MKKFILFIQIILFAFIAKSQITIQGTLTDSLSKQPLAYSNIVVKNKADSVINGTLTNVKGFFKIQVKTIEGIRLIASNLGYRDYEIVLKNESSSKTIKLAKIFLAPTDITLKEANVSAQNEVVQKFDRKVYKMNDNKIAAAKTILDLLRTLPGVVVDAQGNVRYKGATAEVYVDDMPSQYLYPNVEMIPVASVDKIELIDASMRSGGSGKGGIINIKMKVATSDGLSGVVSGRVSTIELSKADAYNSYLNINYKKKKIVAFANLWQYNFIGFKLSTYEGSMNYDNVSYPFFENAYNDNTSFGTTNYGGIIINPSPKTKVIIAGGYYRNGNTVDGLLTHRQIIDNSIYNLYNKVQDDEYMNFQAGGYVHFRHVFDSTARELNGYAYILPKEIDNSGTFNSNYNFIYQNGTQINARNDIGTVFNQKKVSIISGLYYNHPLSAKSRWNLDYTGNYTDIKLQENIISINDKINLPLCINSYGLANTHGLSWRIGTTLGKWKLDAGIKTKLDDWDIYTKRYNQDNQDTLMNVNETYINILPSTTIGFTLDSLQELKLTFARTAKNPLPQELIDFVEMQNPVEWSTGNPDLESVNYNNIYLGYTYIKPMWNFSSEVFYSLTNNEIGYTRYPVSEITTLFYPENIAYENKVGVDLSSYISFKGIYSLNLSSSIYHTNLDASNLEQNIVNLGLPNEELKKKSYGGSLKIVSNLTLSKLANTMLYVNYISREVTFSGYNYGYINSTINFSYKFFKRRLTVVTGINNIFDEFMNHGNYRNSMGFEQTGTDIRAGYFARFYFVMLRYNFRQGDRNSGRIGSN